MRIITGYEAYIQKLYKEYRYSEIPDSISLPSWVAQEGSVFYWLLQLYSEINNRYINQFISDEIMEELRNIRESKMLKCNEISPALKNSRDTVVEEIAGLYEDLQNDSLWEHEHKLTKEGRSRWKKSVDVVYEATCLTPPEDYPV